MWDLFDDTEFFSISQSIPHIQFTSDFLIGEEVGPGHFTGGALFAFANYKLDGADNINFTFFNGGIRGGYALNPLVGESIEPYGGIELLYHYVLVSDSETGAAATFGSDGSVALSFYLGARLHLLKKFGLYAEIDPLYTVFKSGLFFNL